MGKTRCAADIENIANDYGLTQPDQKQGAALHLFCPASSGCVPDEYIFTLTPNRQRPGLQYKPGRSPKNLRVGFDKGLFQKPLTQKTTVTTEKTGPDLPDLLLWKLSR